MFRLNALLLIGLINSTAQSLPADLFVIVPGERVGPVTRKGAVEKLFGAFTGIAVKEQKCGPGEGLPKPKSCYLVAEGATPLLKITDFEAGNRLIEILDPRFKSREGVALSNTLGELTLANCMPFEFYPPKPSIPGAQAGLITDWGASGALCQSVWAVVEPTQAFNEYESVATELLNTGVPKNQIYSRWPELRKFKMAVTKLSIELDESLETICRQRAIKHECLRSLEK